MRAVRVRSRHFNGRRPNGLISVIRLRDKSSYARDKNTSAELCAKNAGGAYARGRAYLRDTTVFLAKLHYQTGLKHQYLNFSCKMASNVVAIGYTKVRTSKINEINVSYI